MIVVRFLLFLAAVICFFFAWYGAPAVPPDGRPWYRGGLMPLGLFFFALPWLIDSAQALG